MARRRLQGDDDPRQRLATALATRSPPHGPAATVPLRASVRGFGSHVLALDDVSRHSLE
jgi:hypothetical protein